MATVDDGTVPFCTVFTVYRTCTPYHGHTGKNETVGLQLHRCLLYSTVLHHSLNKIYEHSACGFVYSTRSKLQYHTVGAFSFYSTVHCHTATGVLVHHWVGAGCFPACFLSSDICMQYSAYCTVENAYCVSYCDTVHLIE